MYGPAGFENEFPYTNGVVKFPSGVQMFGRITAQAMDSFVHRLQRPGRFFRNLVLGHDEEIDVAVGSIFTPRNR